MKKRRRIAAAALALTGVLLCSAALAEGTDATDPYVYKLDEYWSASTHAVGYEEKKEDGESSRECVVTFKLVDTSEENDGASAGESAEGASASGEESAKEKLYSAYCCDIETPSILGSYYRMLNLEDSTYFDDETAATIRGIVQNGFAQDWKEEDLAAAQAAANAWLAAQGKESVIEGMTYAEALSATQAAVWTYANLSTHDITPYHSTYGYITFGTYDHEEGYDDETWCKVEYEKEFTAGENTKSNIENFYDYLINQQGQVPSTVLFSDNEFISSEAVFTEDSLAYNVTVRVKLSGTVGDKDELTLKASLGGQEKTFNLTGEGALVPDENGYYTITFNGLSATAGDEELTASLSLSGSQQVDDVYFFQAKPVDDGADSARKSSQNLVGHAQGQAIVAASGEIKGIKLGTADASLNKYDGSAESTTEQTGTNTVLGTDGNYYPSLSGVTFDLYAKDNDGVYHLVKKGLVSDANGNVYADGLSDEYTYFFRETGTNAGYILKDGYVAAGTALANYRTTTTPTTPTTPEETTEEIPDDEMPKAGGDEEIIVDEDVPLAGLPNTGAGSDTALYLLIAGVCALALAAVLALKKNRKA